MPPPPAVFSPITVPTPLPPTPPPLISAPHPAFLFPTPTRGVTIRRPDELGLSTPLRTTAMSRVVPAGPLILFATSSDVLPLMSSPFTVLTWSHFFAPAFAAGLFGNTCATSTGTFGPGDVML